MRIAFYAPMKPPCHPRPSGDRTMARALTAALTAAGHRVELASRLSSWEGAGDARRQRRLAALGETLAERLLRRWSRAPAEARPDLWFTYHLYHKAPDWLGPRVARGLGLPYVVAEASHAGKQANGPWATGHAAAAAAIGEADLVIGLNSADAEGVRPLLHDRARLVAQPPFIDAEPFRAAGRRREASRRRLCAAHDLDPSTPLLLAAAMMRPGAKLASWQLLARALDRITDRPWQLLMVGDGPVRTDVDRAFAHISDRIVPLGQVTVERLHELYAAADLYVWPAIGEAWGMTLLEAQATGLPVIAGRTGGVPDVVADAESGLLVPVGDAEAFSAAVGAILEAPARLRSMGRAAAGRIARRHDLPVAVRALDAVLRPLVPVRGAPARGAAA